MQAKVIGFYKRAVDFLAFYRQIKLLQCPHCQRTGYLILHGFLRGYDEKSSTKKIIRSHRVFCSDRNRREGCGCTFSVLKDHLLKNSTITTKSIWDFLSNILRGMSTFAAFNLLALPFSVTSGYRLYKRIFQNQNISRTRLLNKSPPPVKVPSRNPLIKTILHLKAAFARNVNPIAAYQAHFQTSFL